MSRWALLVSCAVAIICIIGIAPGAAGTEAGTLAVAAAEETQTCPECGYENKADLNYCIKCGTPLKGEAPGGKTYCTQCGAASPEGSTFCTACGYALEGEKPGHGAASAPPAHRIGIYFTGGLASYEGDMGNSWAAGGGLTITLWTRPGAAQLSLGLSSDVGFSMIDDKFEGILGSDVFKISLIPIRETALLGLAFGPRKMIKPFCGFGGGVGLLTWEYVLDGLTLDEGTSVKPVFDFPFGCEFHLTPNFALGVKADYLIIPGDIEMEWIFGPYRWQVNASVPDVFLFGGTARFNF
jgi:hypothetical protein